MSPRRAAIAVATYVAAILVALAVPMSQLRTISIVTTCCCPDPARCHCPDHKADPTGAPSMRACHKTSHETIAAQLPSFAAPEVALAVPAARVAAAIVIAPSAPHAPPAADEPYGPS